MYRSIFFQILILKEKILSPIKDYISTLFVFNSSIYQESINEKNLTFFSLR